MTKLQKILYKVKGHTIYGWMSIEEAEKEILKWHNSKQLTEGKMARIIAKYDIKPNCGVYLDRSKCRAIAHSIKEAMDKFMDFTQKKVEGVVNIKLLKGTASVVGRISPNPLYKKELATYGKGDKFDQSLAKGFVELWGLPYKKR